MLNGQKLQGPQTSAEIYKLLEKKNLVNEWVRVFVGWGSWVSGAHRLICFFQVSVVLCDLPDLLPGQRCAGLHHLSAEPPRAHLMAPVRQCRCDRRQL